MGLMEMEMEKRVRRLDEVLGTVEVLESVGPQGVPIAGIAFDSRRAQPQELFVAIRGLQSDGHRFIDSVVAGGATAVVCQELPAHRDPRVAYVRVRDSARALGLLACNYYGNPSRALQLVGITGTNGKTTTVTLLWQLANQLGARAGLISTVQNCIGPLQMPSQYTTPDAVELNQLLRSMVDQGCTHCFMEVSSHALAQGRVEGVEFAGGIFSNITHDHLDYHHTFDEYLRAKRTLFAQLPATAFALTNLDDRNGHVMVQSCRAKVYTYSLRAMASFRCRVIEHRLDGMLLNMDGMEVWTHLIGGFNAYNLLAIYGTARLLGFDQQPVLTALSAMRPVSGRFQHSISKRGVVAVVDYAHTPDALSNVIDTINHIKPAGKKLITVVGAGGNRDKAKRPIMARVAVMGSEMVILTSDNPRLEEPEDIIAQMRAGVEPQSVGKVLCIADRREAIRTACMLAGEGDIVLIAGKGHETYQEVKGVRHPFDDREEVARCFAEQHE